MAKLTIQRVNNNSEIYRQPVSDDVFERALQFYKTNRLDQLEDVVEPANVKQGQTLVYNEDDDTYIVKSPGVDGGEY